jgi:hypothetical protein
MMGRVAALMVVPEWLVWFGIGIVAVAIVVAINSAMAKKRSRAMAQVAGEIGFSFEERSKEPEQVADLKTVLFRKGTGHDFRNVMTGSSAGLRAGLFDYSFVTPDGRSGQTIAQTVAVFTKTGVAMAEFELEPIGIMQKIGEALVHKNIRFDSHPDLSQRYQLRSPDADRTRELFTIGLLSYIEKLDPEKKWRLEGMGETLTVYRSGKRVAPGEMRAFFDEASSIAGSFFGLGSFRVKV